MLWILYIRVTEIINFYTLLLQTKLALKDALYFSNYISTANAFPLSYPFLIPHISDRPNVVMNLICPDIHRFAESVFRTQI